MFDVLADMVVVFHPWIPAWDWQAVAEAATFVVASMIVIVIPINIWALYWAEWRSAIREAETDPRHRYQPALFLARSYCKLTLAIQVVVISVFLLRVYLQVIHSNTDIEGQPTWSYLLSVVTATAVLALFTWPPVSIWRLKRQILMEAGELTEREARRNI